MNNSDPRLTPEIIKKNLTLRQYFAFEGMGVSKDGFFFRRNESTPSAHIVPNTDDQAWVDFGDGAKGDVITLHMERAGCDFNEALRQLAAMCGIHVPEPQKAPTARRNSFPWQTYRDALTPQDLARLAAWRGYSLATCERLKAEGLIGVVTPTFSEGENGKRKVTAHPSKPDDAHRCIGCFIRDEHGQAIGIHYATGKDKPKFSYYPQDQGVRPLIIGDPSSAPFTWFFESQWDAFAVLDALGWPLDPAIVITRGASNACNIKPRSAVLWHQRDAGAAEKWREKRLAEIGAVECRDVFPPDGFKDWNDAHRENINPRPYLDAAKPFIPPPSAEELRAERIVARDEQAALEASAPFPWHAFPPIIRDAVECASQSPQIIPELAAMLSLVVAGALGESRLKVRSVGMDATTGANLFLISASASGTGKTATFNQFARPLFSEQKRRIDLWKNEECPRAMATAKAAKNVEKKLLLSHAEAVEKGHDTAPFEQGLAENAKVLQDAQSARCRGIVAEDATSEALLRAAHANGGFITSVSDDARSAAAILQGKYRKDGETDDSAFLKGFSGSAYGVNRVETAEGMSRSFFIDELRIALCWFIQPDILSGVLQNDALTAGGFLPRSLIFRVPDREVPELAEPVANPWLLTYYDQCEQIAQLPARVWELTGAARAYHRAQHDEVRNGTDGERARHAAFVARYQEIALRVSLVLAILTDANEVDESLIRNAWAIVRWCAGQCEALRDSDTRMLDRQSERVINYLGKQPDPVTSRVVGRSVDMNAAETGAVLRWLVDSGLCERLSVKGQRKSVDCYRLTKAGHEMRRSLR